MATQKHSLLNLMYSSFRYWENEYLRKLLIFKKITEGDEYEFLEKNIDELRSTRTIIEGDNKIKEKIKKLHFRREPFNSKKEGHQSYFDMHLEKYKRDQQKKFDIEESFLNFLKTKLQRLPKQKRDTVLENPYPEYFVDDYGFCIFHRYITKHNVNPRKDLSFIFHKLKDMNGIKNKITHMEFAGFAKDKYYIRQQDYNAILKNKGLDNKSDSSERLNNFEHILKGINGS